LLATNQTELTDKNLFCYCDNDPVNRADGDGELWKLALASGGALGALGSSALAAIGAVATAGAVAVGIVATVAIVVKVVEVSVNIYRSERSRTKAPAGRPELKKQGREGLEKKKAKSGYTKRSGKAPRSQPRSHHPSKKGHRKY
jgi:hypothetical protein